MADNKLADFVAGYDEWLGTLTEPQIRALASQVGIESWNDDSHYRLRELLSASLDALGIYEDNIV